MKGLKQLTYIGNMGDVIDACKEALEQPAQEPVMIEDCNAARQILEYKNKQPAQEPVSLDSEQKKMLYDIMDDAQKWRTHPAPAWQGLSDDEVEDLCYKYWDSKNGYSVGDIIDMAEQALKEKNIGGNE